MIKLLILSALIAQGTSSESYVMPEVVVTATRLSIPVAVSPWPVEVIKLEDDETSDLAQKLNAGVSADVRSYGYEGHTAFPILGGVFSSRVLILENGVPLNSRRDGVIDLSLLPLSPGARIEIVKGPLSALYGSSAIGGVINIIPSNRNGLSANFAATNQMGMNVGARAAHTWGIFGASLSGSYLKNPGFRHNDKVSRYNAKAALWLNPHEALNIEINTGYGARNLGTPGAAPNSKDTAFVAPKFGDSLVSSLYNHQNDKLLNAGLKTSFTPSEKFTACLNIYTLNQGFEYHSKYTGYNADFTTYTAVETDTYADSKLGADLQLKGDVGEFLVLTGGISAVNESFNGKQLATDSNSAKTVKDTSWKAQALQLSGWLEGIGRLGIFTPTLALRADHSAGYGVFISPEGGLAVELIPKTLSVSAAYGQSFRAPTFNDLYWPASAFSGGDSTLTPERGQSAALSLRLTPVSFASFQLSASWKKINDMIAWNPDSAGFWKPFNVDLVNVISAEFLSTYQFGDEAFTGSLGLCYNNAKETREILTYSGYDANWKPVVKKEKVSRQAAFIPPLSVKAKAAIRAWQGGKFALSAVWTDKRINYYADWSKSPDIGVITKTIDPSLKLDACVSQKLFKLLRLEVGVRNILNDTTPAHFGSAKDLDYPTAPRRFYAALSVSYH